jgi:hypothetical protein
MTAVDERTSMLNQRLVLRVGRTAAVLALLFVGSVPTAGAAPILSLEGATTGCFDAGCTYQTVDLLQGLTFTGDDFSTTLDANTTDTANVSLGSFSVDRAIQYNYASSVFNLLVSFTLPGLASDDFVAAISGNINQSGNGTITIDFNQTPVLFEFTDAGGSGTFELVISSDPQLQRGVASASISGLLQNLTYTPTSIESDPVSTVPEPSSLLLLVTGMIGGGLCRKRRSTTAHQG